MIPDLSFRTGCETGIQLSFWRSGKNFTIRILTVCNSIWNLNRALSKVNYRIHTDAVKENLIPPELTPEQIAYTLASINLSAVSALPGGDM